MKPKSTLNWLIFVGSSLFAVPIYDAWTQTATDNQDWTNSGNWSRNTQFVLGSGNKLMFFAETTTITTTLPDGAPL